MSELEAKHAKLQALHNALTRAKAAQLKEKSYAASVYVQKLEQQIAGLRKTFPPIRLA